ncbi:hypothetical protein AB4254_11635 [Vibrio breoganii]
MKFTKWHAIGGALLVTATFAILITTAYFNKSTPIGTATHDDIDISEITEAKLLSLDATSAEHYIQKMNELVSMKLMLKPDNQGIISYNTNDFSEDHSGFHILPQVYKARERVNTFIVNYDQAIQDKVEPLEQTLASEEKPRTNEAKTVLEQYHRTYRDEAAKVRMLEGEIIQTAFDADTVYRSLVDDINHIITTSSASVRQIGEHDHPWQIRVMTIKPTSECQLLSGTEVIRKSYRCFYLFPHPQAHLIKGYTELANERFQQYVGLISKLDASRTPLDGTLNANLVEANRELRNSIIQAENLFGNLEQLQADLESAQESKDQVIASINSLKSENARLATIKTRSDEEYKKLEKAISEAQEDLLGLITENFRITTITDITRFPLQSGSVVSSVIVNTDSTNYIGIYNKIIPLEQEESITIPLETSISDDLIKQTAKLVSKELIENQ